MKKVWKLGPQFTRVAARSLDRSGLTNFGFGTPSAPRARSSTLEPDLRSTSGKCELSPTCFGAEEIVEFGVQVRPSPDLVKFGPSSHSDWPKLADRGAEVAGLSRGNCCAAFCTNFASRSDVQCVWRSYVEATNFHAPKSASPGT